MKKRILIVGQGLAGSLIAWKLWQSHYEILIVDNHHHQSSTAIAAGIINPIIGQRFTTSDRFLEFYKSARILYSELETQFHKKFFHNIPLTRLFRNSEEQHLWVQRKAAMNDTPIQTVENSAGHFSPHVQDSFGSVTAYESGYCDSAALIEKLRTYFLDRNRLHTELLNYKDFVIAKNHICWKNKTFDTVIFCEGFQTPKNPWFQYLPFNNSRGDVLTVTLDSPLKPDHIWNQGQWLVPIGNHYFRAGSTYESNPKNDKPCLASQKRILKSLQNILAQDMHVTKHSSGIRPAFEDTQPILGNHPIHKNLKIFNGLGSKGVLTAPFYAQQLFEFIDRDGPLEPQVSSERFQSFHSSMNGSDL